MNRRAGILFIVIGFLVSISFIAISATRQLSTLENTLLQVFSLGFGLAGSYVLGQASARDAAIGLIKPHARSAFRRLVSLTKSLARLAQTMQEIRPRESKNAEAAMIVDRLEAIVIEQIAVAADALEDWRDVLPEEFRALQERPLSSKATQ